MPTMRALMKIVETNRLSVTMGSRRENLSEARHVKNEVGIFLLNPSPMEYRQFFAGKEGAAFYVDQNGDVALGAGSNGSVDHGTISQTFSLGEEACRGYITGDTNGGMIEVWANNSSDDVSPEDQKKVEANVEKATHNPCLSRIVKSWQVTVFNEDYVEIDGYSVK